MSTDEKTPSDTDHLDELESESALATQATSLEADALAAQADAGQAGAGKRTVGLERWVQLGYMILAILLVWLFDHVINAIWYLFADPNESIVTALAVLTGLLTTTILYKNQATYGIVHGISEELSKVTWPTRKETSSSTVVVVVTSIVAALMLFLFDSVWSAVTDLVYKV
jgi:preprotein translocase subunit SecE